MRYHTGVQATRSTPPRIKVATFPNPQADPEVHIDFGGLGMWMSEPEATAFGQQLIEAGIRIRTDRENRDPRERAEYIAASKADAALSDWRPSTNREIRGES